MREEFNSMYDCRDCANRGSCVGLHYCGGLYFQSRFIPCKCCGEEFDPDESDYRGEYGLCDKCNKEKEERDEYERLKKKFEKEAMR